VKKNIFSQKIKYLFETLKIEEEEFIKLFWDGSKTTLKIRKKSVVEKWYEGDIAQPKAFYFDTYPISKIKIEDRYFFTKSSFLSEPFDEFKKRVDEYVSYISQPKERFEYKYIYYYDTNLAEITFVKLYVLEELSNHRYKIKIMTSDLYKDREFEPYYGQLEIIKDYYYISVKNSFEIVSFYFILNRGYKNSDEIYGLRLGLSYNKGSPISEKNLLSKNILSKKAERELYLHINESEILIADESNENIDSDIKRNYIKKIYKKIRDITTYSKRVREIFDESLNKNIYLSVFHNILGALNEISKKTYLDKTFYSSRRRAVREIFLKKLASTPNSSCKFVYSICAKDATLFSNDNENSKKALNLIIKFAKDGLKIDMIIVVKEGYKPTEYLKENIKRIIDSNIDIKIAIKDTVQKVATSYDFLYSETQRVAVYKNGQDRACYFKVTKDIDIIRNLSYDFDNIKKIGYSFDDFIK